MQNLIVLCQRCFSWVEPIEEICPECGVDVAIDRPDLERDVLTEIVGTPLVHLGIVRVERLALPSFGELVGTDEGILFLPRLNRRLNGAWEEVSTLRAPSWWPFRGDLNSPRFLDWLRRPASAKIDSDVSSAATVELKQTLLADRLMDSPGGFFVKHRLINNVVARRRLVRFDRLQMRSVTLVDESETGTLKASLDSFLAKTACQETRSDR